jgi:hypothetical protein
VLLSVIASRSYDRETFLMSPIGSAARISAVDRHFRSFYVLGNSFHLTGDRKFVTAFTRARHCTCPEPDEIIPHPNLFLLDPF